MPTFDFVHDLSDNLSKKKTAHLVISFARKDDLCSVNVFSGAIKENSAVVLMEALKNISKELAVNKKSPDYLDKFEEACHIICKQGIEYIILTIKKNKAANYTVTYNYNLRDKKGVLLAKQIIGKILEQYKAQFPKNKKFD